MRTKKILVGVLISVGLAACADHSASVPTPAGQLTSASAVTPFAISGAVFIPQRMALPKDSVLTVTLSDAATGQGATRVLAQQVYPLNGKQAPFHYSLPLQNVKLGPNSQAFLSAAVTLNGRVVFATDRLHPVATLTQQQQNITLIPTTQVAIPVAAQ